MLQKNATRIMNEWQVSFRHMSSLDTFFPHALNELISLPYMTWEDEETKIDGMAEMVFGSPSLWSLSTAFNNGPSRGSRRSVSTQRQFKDNFAEHPSGGLSSKKVASDFE